MQFHAHDSTRALLDAGNFAQLMAASREDRALVVWQSVWRPKK